MKVTNYVCNICKGDECLTGLSLNVRGKCEKVRVEDTDKHICEECLLDLHEIYINKADDTLNEAIKHIKNTQCRHNSPVPYLILGDISELITILTGKVINWEELKYDND